MKPVITDGKEKRWTLYVGGTEVNDFLHDFQSISDLAEEYIDDGYDDVVCYQYDTGEEVRLG